MERGEIRARLEPLVLHELTYVLPRLVKQMGRQDVATYLIVVITWPGVDADKEMLVDAYLASLANRDRCPVYTKNIQAFSAQGVEVPDPLAAPASG